MMPVTATRVIRVLVVDDHPLFREGLVAALLRDPAFEVVGTAETARDALAAIARLDPDLVIAELNLPDARGTDLCARLQSAHPRARLLVLTGTTAGRVAMNAFRSGARGFVVKTAFPAEVVSAARAVASNESYVDPQVAHTVVKEAVQSRGPANPHGLSGQELRVLELVHLGLPDHQIASQLGTSTETVLTYIGRAIQRLGVPDRRAAVRMLRREGVL